MVLTRRKAADIVEGMLAGANYSKPKWADDEHCTVEATLVVSPEVMKALRATVWTQR